jgi:hypothetical protein
VLKRRAPGLGAPIQMSDALARNTPKLADEVELLVGNCLAHARFGLSEDVLKPYKEALDHWLWPDVLRNQDASVAKAKQAISNYRKAVGEPAGLAELMVYYSETAAGFSSDIGLQDEGFFDALVRMFEQALRVTLQLPPRDCDAMISSLIDDHFLASYASRKSISSPTP